MNKQQLATKIWEAANKMRSKIEANEYKDYILGFIFYKYLSDAEEKFLYSNGYDKELIATVVESDADTVEWVQDNLGYFIDYNNLFSTWLDKGSGFDVSNVRDALSAFSRLISESHQKVFQGIFETLQTGLSKLGDSSGSQTKAIKELLDLIKDIPMDGKQDYDVLGFIYEYLISMFAANAGKKAGEFYTPHEVSLLMSEIISDHLKDNQYIEIYDPTSGSGSLLINIGKSVAKRIGNSNNIKYYAQELKSNTYNLTRMNLVMRGIKPDNIVARNGDTLEDDWPYFDEANKETTYTPLYVDAVVSNPPYSQKWTPKSDVRYERFGLAPKGKADYAFLLHDLYHIKPSGIMAIVLPHGVLFRGGEEGEIRKNLIEYNHIDAIIGLPANIFFGTGIPTIIMILKQKRSNTDVLIVDASKGFAKEGKNNKLRASDIKRIADTVINRLEIPKYSKLVSREEIRQNDYNLNIPRYVDSSEAAESWDIYASMFGGIPKAELATLDDYWKAFPNLQEALFEASDTPYTQLTTDNIKEAIRNHADVTAFENNFAAAFAGFPAYLHHELIEQAEQVAIAKEENIISDKIFTQLSGIPLVDKYAAFQLLDDEWSKIAVDLEIIQTEGFGATKKVDPNMVLKKKDNKEQEVRDGWIGHVLPFSLVQDNILVQESTALKKQEARLAEISDELSTILDEMSEDEKETTITNDTNDSFVAKEVKKMLDNILGDISTPEIENLKEYLMLSKKTEKLQYIASHNSVDWKSMQQLNDKTYSKSTVKARLITLYEEYTFPNGSFEATIVKIASLLNDEKELKASIKADSTALHLLTKETIESLTDEQVKDLLHKKWIESLMVNLNKMPETLVDDFVSKLTALQKKYALTYADIDAEIYETEQQLCAMLGELTGSTFDMKGINEFKALLQGE